MRYEWAGEKGKHPPKVALGAAEFEIGSDGKFEIAEHERRWERMLQLVDLGFAPDPDSFPPGVHSGIRRLLRSKGVQGF